MLPNMKRAAPNDWVKRPVTAIVWWCLPLCLGIFVNVLMHSPRVAAIAWAILLAWMGTGCALNAWRCQRLHCFISGPVFFLGAVAASLVAAGVLVTRLNNIVGATLVLALASFIPEVILAARSAANSTPK